MRVIYQISLPYPQSGIDKYGPYEYALPVRFGSDSQCLATNLQAIIETLYQPICEFCKSLCSKPLTTQDYKTQNARRSMHQYSNNDILQRTGLKPDFINHCNSKLGDLLGPFRIKGDKNKILYDGNGLRLWDVIKQHKERGENIRQIRKALERIVRPDSQTTEPPSKPTSQTFQTNPQTSQGTEGKGRGSEQALVKIEHLYERMLEDKERQIVQAQERTDEVKQVLRMLLPPGKTPEQVKAERDETQRHLADQGRKLKELLDEKRASHTREQGRRERRRALISTLGNLHGWSKGKRRREILNQLGRLEAEA